MIRPRLRPITFSMPQLVSARAPGYNRLSHAARVRSDVQNTAHCVIRRSCVGNIANAKDTWRNQSLNKTDTFRHQVQRIQEKISPASNPVLSE